MQIVLLFSFEISLEDWSETGLLDREPLLYKELGQKFGVTSKFVTYGGAWDRKWSESLGSPGSIKIIPVYEDRPPAHGRLWRLISSLLLPWRIGQELRSADLFKSNQMMGAWVGALAKLRFGKPFLLRTGYELSEFLRLGRAPWTHRVGGWVISYICYQLADQIHVATNEDKRIVQKRFRIPAHKIHIRPNWIDTRNFCPSPLERDRGFGVLFVGRFAEQKNLPLLLDALVGTNVKLTLVGTGSDERAIRERLSSGKISVKSLIGVPNSDMPSLYQQSAIYVICSRYEGNPKTLLEAMACECAVIGTDVRGIRDVIQDGRNGLLVKEDAISLRSAIMTLVNDRALRTRLGKAARESVVQDYSLDSAAAAEWRTYTEMLVKNSIR